MGYEEYAVDPALQGWVKCFWSIVDEPSDEVQEVWPDGCIELLFSPGNTFRVHADGSSERFPRVTVVGLQTGIMRVRAEGEVRLLGARILPFGMRDWQPEDLETLAERIEPLIRETRFAEACKILEGWLLQQPPVEDTLSAVLRTLYATGGTVSIVELATAQGISSRHLQRTFAAQLGLSPKTLAKLVRFARSWSTMLRRPDMSLADLALELGYSDQAHLTNDFRALGRESPRVFRKRWTKP